MIIRSLIFFVIVAAIGTLVHIGSAAPGFVKVQWFGMEISANPVFATLVLGFLAIFLFLAGRVWAWLVYVPKLLETWRNSRHAKGEIHTLVSGMEALLLEDDNALRRLSRANLKSQESVKLLPYFKAGVAEKKADYTTAQQNLTQLLENKTTALIGLKGLIQLAEKQENWPEVLTLSSKANRLRNGTPWALRALMKANTHLQNYQAAVGLLPALYKNAVEDYEKLDNLSACLHTKLAEEDIPPKKALKLAEKALKSQPDFVPALVLKGALYQKMGKERAAEKWLADAWQKTRCSTVFSAWKASIATQPAAKQIKKAQALTKNHMGTVAGHMALADVYVANQKYAEARVHLLEAAGAEEHPQIFRKLAELEDLVQPGARKGYDWLKKAMEAPFSPAQHPSVSAYQTWQNKINSSQQQLTQQ